MEGSVVRPRAMSSSAPSPEKETGRPEGPPGPAAGPFFIVGCGRSGTTLLRLMLNQHRSLAIPLESLFIADYLTAPQQVPIRVVQWLMAREYELKEWGIEVDARDLDSCTNVPALLDALHGRYARSMDKPRWGQKTPRLVRFGAEIKRAFPDAKFVHLVRDPRAVVRSLMRSPVHRYTLRSGVRRWRRDVSFGLALKERWPSHVLEVRYSSLVRDPEPTLRSICTFLGEAFDPACLSYAAVGSGEYSQYYQTIHATLNQSPETKKIDAWKTDLSEREIGFVEDRCTALMLRYGFEPIGASDAARPNVVLEPARWVSGMARRLIHYLRYRPGYLLSVALRRGVLGCFRAVGGPMGKLLGTLLGVLFFAVAFSQAGAGFRDLPGAAAEMVSTLRASFGGASLLLVTGAFLLVGSLWHRCLRLAGADGVPHWKAVRVWTITLFAKYVPGSIWHYVGRVESLRALGIRRTATLRSMAFEASVLVISALFLGGLAVLLSGGWSGDLPEGRPMWAVVGGLLVGGPLGVRWVTHGRARLVSEIAAIAMARWIVVGLGFYMLTASLTPLPSPQLMWIAFGVFPLAWAAGFLAVMVPGGVGVREAVLVLFLTPILGPAEAAALSIIARLWWMLGEAGSAAVGLLVPAELAESVER